MSFANRLTSVQFNVIYSTIFVTINIFAYVLQWNFLFFILYSIIVTIYSILLFLFQTFKTDATLYFKAQKNYFNSGLKNFMKSSKVNFYTKSKEYGYDTKWIFKYDEKTVLKEINNNLNFRDLNLFFRLLPEDLVIYKEKQFNFYKELLNLYSYNFFNKEITDGFFLYQIPLILDKFNKFMTALPNNKEYSTIKYLLLREFMWQIKSFLESNKIKKRFVCPSEKFWKYFNIFDSKALNEMFLVYVRNKTIATFLKHFYNDDIKKYAKKSNLKKLLVLPQLINDIEEADGKIKNIINDIYGTSEEILKKIKSKISESEREMEQILNKYKDYINLQT